MTPLKLLLPGCLVGMLAGFAAERALGQQMFIYPAHGQSPAEQQQDQYQCSGWAAQQTGFDPNIPPPQPPPPPQVGGPFLFGAIRRARLEQEADAMVQQQMSAYAAKKSSYQHAMTACLVGRGYTVN